MVILKFASPFLALLAAFAGLWAAHLWWKASSIGPQYGEGAPFDDDVGYHLAAPWEGQFVSGNMNARAARWTSVSAGLSAVAGICAVLDAWLSTCPTI